MLIEVEVVSEDLTLAPAGSCPHSDLSGVYWFGNGFWPRAKVLRLRFLDYLLSDPTVDFYCRRKVPQSRCVGKYVGLSYALGSPVNCCHPVFTVFNVC